MSNSNTTRALRCRWPCPAPSQSERSPSLFWMRARLPSWKCRWRIIASPFGDTPNRAKTAHRGVKLTDSCSSVSQRNTRNEGRPYSDQLVKSSDQQYNVNRRALRPKVELLPVYNILQLAVFALLADSDHYENNLASLCRSILLFMSFLLRSTMIVI